MTKSAIFTVGHGRHPFDEFLALLQQHEIEFLCDVRSFARSRWPQFNGLVLHELLNENGIGYEHIPECGGKLTPDQAEIEKGLERIIEVASDLRTVMMCSESKPLTDHKVPRARCHRVGMLAPMLRARGFDRIIHILPNGDSAEFDESVLAWAWLG